jgi:NUMOD4 motif/HNH endonuclease
MEEWKKLERFPGYLVSNKGDVKSLKGRTEKFLKQVETKDGYKFVCLSVNNKKFTSYVHRLVGEAFLDTSDIILDKAQVNHKDKNITNNCVENLEWVSYSENMFHRDEPELYKLFSQVKNLCQKMNIIQLKEFVEFGNTMLR